VSILVHVKWQILEPDPPSYRVGCRRCTKESMRPQRNLIRLADYSCPRDHLWHYNKPIVFVVRKSPKKTQPWHTNPIIFLVDRRPPKTTTICVRIVRCHISHISPWSKPNQLTTMVTQNLGYRYIVSQSPETQMDVYLRIRAQLLARFSPRISWFPTTLGKIYAIREMSILLSSDQA
jgi:hypothetical protein